MSAAPLPQDTWDLMSKAELAAFLAERGHTAKASATRAQLAEQARKAAISHFLRRREDDHRRALAVLRGQGYGYTHAEAVGVLEDLIIDANAQGRALNYAHMQLHRLQQVVDAAGAAARGGDGERGQEGRAA